MTKQEELLTILMEECGEVIIEASKIKRFGDMEYNGETALQRLEKELGDLQCMIELLHEEFSISYEIMEEQSKKKREKLKKWSSLFE